MSAVVLTVVGLMAASQYLTAYSNAIETQAVLADVVSAEVIDLVSLGLGGGNYANVRDEAALRLYASANSLKRFSVDGETDVGRRYALVYESSDGAVYRLIYESEFRSKLDARLAKAKDHLARSPGHYQFSRLLRILKRRDEVYWRDQSYIKNRRQHRDCRNARVNGHRFVPERLELHLFKRTTNKNGGEVCLVFNVAHMKTLRSRVMQATLPTAILGLFVGVFLVMLLADRLIRPIERLTAYVRTAEVAATDSEDALAPGGQRQDEVGVLARAFTDLLERVRGQLLLLTEKSDEAQAASHAKSQFLATISHEMRTPLNGIIGMTELALHGNLDESKRDILQTAKDSGELLLTIINDLLDFSKIEAGRIDLEILDVHLSTFLSDTLTLVRPAADAKDLRLILEIDEALPSNVRVDPLRLKQVLLNLLGNAIKFTDKGEVRIRALRTDDDALRFEVQDDGIGILPDAQGKLFQRFHQADISTTRQYGGTGLGLAICRGLVEGVMGGRIGLKSVKGVGSTFWAEISLVQGSMASKPTETGDSDPTDRRPRLRLLVVDDNAVNRAVASRMLAALGHEVELANDGVEAVEMVQENSYSLVFMDWQMPRLDGLEATRRIQALGTTGSSVPIVGLTANASRLDRNECLDSGMVDVLSKPVKMKALARCIDEWATHATGAP